MTNWSTIIAQAGDNLVRDDIALCLGEIGQLTPERINFDLAEEYKPFVRDI